MRRTLRILSLTLLGLVIVLLLGVGLLLGTQTGSQWLLRQVPGLEVDGFQGRLGGSWRAARIDWQQGEMRLRLDQPALMLRAACLLRRTLCLDSVIAERLALQLPPATDNAEPAAGPGDLRLPLALEVRQLEIGELSIDGESQVQQARLAGHWDADGLRIDRLQLRRDEVLLELQGQLQPVGNWPLEVTGELGLPAPDGQPWRVEVELSGELQQRVRVRALSEGYLQARLQGEAAPLGESLPAQLSLRVENFLATADLPPGLRLDGLELQAAGDLKVGYRIQGQGEFAGEGGAVSVDLEALLDEAGLTLDDLTLRTDEERRARLHGRLDWHSALAAEVGLDWRDFPWQQLYPLEEPLPVRLHQAQAQLSYREERYEGRFSAELDGPAGPFHLASPVAGDHRSLRLPGLQLAAGAGGAEGTLELGFVDGLSWNGQFQLRQLDPAYWLAELPGRLDGPLNSRGSLRDGQLSLAADLALSGPLRGQPSRLQGEVQGDGTQWQISALELRLGDNRVQGQLGWGEQLTGALDIGLSRLGQLWPDLSGSLTGTLALAGSRQAPQGQLQLSGRQLAFDRQRLAALTMKASLDSTQNGSFDLRADALRSGDMALGQLRVEGRGDRHRQHLMLDLQGEKIDLQLALGGDWDGRDWRGQLRRGQLQSGGQDWRLAQPAALQRLADGRLLLGEHCWRHAEASLCAQRQQLLPEPQLAFRLDDFPLATLQPWLPQDLEWQGRLNAEVDLSLDDAGPRGRVEVDAGGGLLRLREGEEWLEFPYRTLALDSRLGPRRVDSQLHFAGERLGELALTVGLDPRPADKPISGEFRLSGFKLGVLRPFLARVERLEGNLEGSGQLSGGLQAPRIDGHLRLVDGHLSGGQLPTRFQDLHLDVRIAGEHAELDGGWRSGEQGRGRIDGRLSWAGAPEVDIRIGGEHLPVVVAPYATLQVEPDLRLYLVERQLALSGRVAVPRGSIVIRELPPQAVKVSSDEVLVDVEAQKAEPLALKLDIELDVGRERLRFSGFGLKGELQGQLHVGDQMRTSGVLNLRDGRYRAYGQNLELRRARLQFAGPLDQPFLDIEAIRRVDDVTVGLRLTGRADQPQSEIFSTPAMSQEQALSYLVLGRPLGGSGDQDVVGQAALALGLAGGAPIASGLASRLGIEDFQLEKEGSGLTTSVVASGQLSERLSLRYGVGLFQPVNTLALRYELSKRLYLEAASGLAGSLDLFYKRDF